MLTAEELLALPPLKEGCSLEEFQARGALYEKQLEEMMALLDKMKAECLEQMKADPDVR